MCKGVKDRNDVDSRNKYEETALIEASFLNYVDVVRLLLTKNADVNLWNYKGETSLIIASSLNHIEIVELLLNAGANVDFHDTYGYTALMNASRKGNSDVVKALLNKNADPNRKNIYGKTAYDLARNEEIEKLLEKYNEIQNLENNCHFNTLTIKKEGKLVHVLPITNDIIFEIN
jgi:ankyrin repeat protein